MNRHSADIPAVADRIANLIFTAPDAFGKSLHGMQPVRWLARQRKLIHHEKDGFQATGRSCHIALFCTGLPEEMQQPFDQMVVRPTKAARIVDPNRHDLLNLTLLKTWLPDACYSIYVLPCTASLSRLRIDRQDLLSALEDCRGNTAMGRPVDYIISSIFPGDGTGILQDAALFNHSIGRPMLSFWPAGNYRGAGPRRLDFPIADTVVMAGQLNQRSEHGAPAFEVRDDVRYHEAGLPHVWAPNPAPGHALTSGSSYSTVPTALVWIKLREILGFLAEQGLAVDRMLDSPDVMHTTIRSSRTFQSRIRRSDGMAFLDEGLGLVNLPQMLEHVLKAQDMTPDMRRQILDVFSQPVHQFHPTYDTYSGFRSVSNA